MFVYGKITYKMFYGLTLIYNNKMVYPILLLLYNLSIHIQVIRKALNTFFVKKELNCGTN